MIIRSTESNCENNMLSIDSTRLNTEEIQLNRTHVIKEFRKPKEWKIEPR